MARGFGTSVAKFVSGGLGMFLPHRLANDAAVGSALLGRVWIFTFVDLLFEESGVSKGSTGHTWTNNNQNTSACANIWCVA